VRTKIVIASLIAPSIAIITIYVASFLPVIRTSLTDPTSGSFSLSSYSQFFTPAYINTSFMATLRISIFSTVFALVIGYPMAYFAVQHRSPHVRKAILFAAITTFFVNSVVKSFSWYIMLEKYGVINIVMQMIGLPPQGLLFTEAGVIIGETQFLLPFIVLLLMRPVQNVDIVLVEAAKNLGANDVHIFWKIILPLTMRGIVNATLLSILLGLGVFVAPLVLGGGFVITMALLIYNEIINAFEYSLGSAIAVFFTAFTLLVAFFVNRMISHKYSASE